MCIHLKNIIRLCTKNVRKQKLKMKGWLIEAAWLGVNYPFQV